MALTERLQILVTADAKGAAREFDKIGASADKNLGRTEDRLTKLSAGLTSFGTQAVLAAGVAGAGLFKVAESASAYGEQVSRASKTFGDEATPALEEFAKSAAETAGISQTAALQAANTFAVFGRQMGLTGDAAGDFSTSLVQLAGDFASFVDIAPDEAVRVFTSALSGEQEAIKRYGIDLSAAAVEQEALNSGLATSAGELTNAQKVQARYNILLREGQLFAGDFADTSDSLANRQRQLAAEFDNAKVALGEGLLPLAEGAVGALQSVTGAFGRLSPEAQKLGGTIAGVGVAATGIAGGLSLVAGQALKMREAFTTVGADGVRSMNRLGTAVKGIGITAATIASVWALDEALTAVTTNSVELATSMDRLKAADTGRQAFDALVEQTKELDSGWDDLKDTFTDSDIFGGTQGVMEQIGEGAEAVTVDIGNLEQAFKNAADAGNFEGLQAAIDYIREVGYATEGLDGSKLADILNDYEDRIDAAGAASKKTEDEFNDLGAGADGAADGVDILGDAAGDTAKEVDSLGDSVRDAVSPFTDLVDAQTDLDDALGNLGDAQRDLDKLRAAGPDLDGVADALRGIDDAARDVADAYRSWEDAQRGVEDARIDLKRVNEDLTEALQDAVGITPGTVEYDEAQDKIKDLRRDQEDAVRSVEDAQRREQDAARGIADAKRGQADAQRDLTEAQRDAAGFSDEVADAERKVEEARRDVFDATLENTAAQLDFNQKLEDGTADIDAVKGALFAMAQDAPPEVQAALVEMGNMFDLFTLRQVANADAFKAAWGIGGAGDELTANLPSGRYGGYGRGAGQAPSNKDIAVDKFVRGASRALRPRGGRAAGGPVYADGTYMVNERGPELFSPRTSGFVMNAEDTNRLLSGLDQLVQSGGGGGRGTTIERGAITVVAPEPEVAATATVRKMRSAEFLRGGGLR